jgi:hypothetical protein
MLFPREAICWNKAIDQYPQNPLTMIDNKLKHLINKFHIKQNYILGGLQV